MTCLISNPFHGHLPRQLPFVVQIGFAWLPRLSGWQRQTHHPPPLHASKQARYYWLMLAEGHMTRERVRCDDAMDRDVAASGKLTMIARPNQIAEDK
jgi:hypothetical protein